MYLGHRIPHSGAVMLCLPLTCIALLGCQATNLGSSVDPNANNSNQLSTSTSRQSAGGQRPMPAPTPVAMPDTNEITVDGTLASADDVNLFSFGPAQRGDRITVDVTGINGL